MGPHDRRTGTAAALALLGVALAAACRGGSAAPHGLPDPPRAKGAGPREPQVDNGRCLVCHANYQDEPLAVAHAAGGVGCEQCHGESKTHTNDEDNLTAPAVMYPREKINAACLSCHPGSALTREPGPLPGAPPGPAVCTDCHFRHRLARRDRVWDKVSGRLLSEPPATRMTSP